MKVEKNRLSFKIVLSDGQEISIWVWEEKDKERAKRYTKLLSKLFEK